MVFAIVNYSILNVKNELKKGFLLLTEIYIAGEYTVVASTFESELLGKFILTVASSIKLQVECIPSEGAVSFWKHKKNYY